MVEWLEISLITSLSSIEQIVGMLDTLGCVGTARIWNSDLDSEGQQNAVQVIGYLPATEDVVEKLVWLQEQLDYAAAHGWICKPVSVTTKLLDAEEWEAPLREVLPPLFVGQRFIIVLTDDDIDNSENRIILRLRSLGGFGTGHHPTTRMCMEFLEESMSTNHWSLENRQVKGKRVLDVGTGSGILAIAAVKIGASQVIATDIDDAALKAAKENAKRNQVEGKIKFVKSDLLWQVEGQFEIVLSNLLTPLIKDLAWQIRSREALTPEGLWLASGISTEGWKEVKPLLIKLGYRIITEKELEGWVAFKAGLR
ncbi:MAG: 50S ribosomal protein L11 methyltransferase [Armatimonadetes bacterium]|nr:50S ribosomal protein L11 methyltransferase [Armatimonadota bacterium]